MLRSVHSFHFDILSTIFNRFNTSILKNLIKLNENLGQAQTQTQLNLNRNKYTYNIELLQLFDLNYNILNHFTKLQKKRYQQCLSRIWTSFGSTWL